jgi:alkanesulfonate monooxygenase SsuD/methylene tetrahydromethanopterin reductase-like flavin-dependent oxidoreductase (luciferase family)
MRLGLVLAPSPGADPLQSLITQAREAEEAGIDLAWLPADGDSVNALLSAAAIAAQTTTLRLAAAVTVGGHPLGIAEAAAVADNCSAGRVILVLRDPGDAGLLAETTDVIIAAAAPRPFRHEGERWKIPANLPENDQAEERIILAPTFVQTDLPVWLQGPGAAAVSRERGLPCVAAEEDDPQQVARRWSETETALGLAAARLRRVGSFELQASADGRFDDDGLVQELLGARRRWGLDTAVLRPPATLGDGGRSGVIARLARHVRPRVLLHKLPAGLEAHWHEVLAG